MQLAHSGRWPDPFVTGTTPDPLVAILSARVVRRSLRSRSLGREATDGGMRARAGQLLLDLPEHLHQAALNTFDGVASPRSARSTELLSKISRSKRPRLTHWMATFLAFGPWVSCAQATDPAHPVLVELYESQGCSSCPPAIANIDAIARRPDVLALMFAVTYWDQLGLKDTFAKSAFTARQ